MFSYSWVNWFWLIGAVSVVVHWLLARRYPRSFLRYVFLPAFFGAPSMIPPATTWWLGQWVIVGLIFNYFIKKRYLGWWSKFTLPPFSLHLNRTQAESLTRTQLATTMYSRARSTSVLASASLYPCWHSGSLMPISPTGGAMMCQTTTLTPPGGRSRCSFRTMGPFLVHLVGRRIPAYDSDQWA